MNASILNYIQNY